MAGAGGAADAAAAAEQGTSGCYDLSDNSSVEDVSVCGSVAEGSAGASGEDLSGDAAEAADSPSRQQEPLVAGAELAAEAAAATVKLTMQKSRKEGLRLSGQCVLSVDGTQHTLNLECCVEVVPGDGSCWAHAVLRSVRALDIDLLEIRFVRSAASEAPNWPIVFSNLREWKRCGEESVAKKKTTMFREHVARRLLDPQNAALCSEHIQNGPSEDDLGAGGMAAAEARATELGLAYDLQKPQHHWAIALLNDKTQFSAPVMQAMLRVDFSGLFAVVNLFRKTVSKFDSADTLKRPKREVDYGFSGVDQQTVLSGARILIYVLHESADPFATLEDPALDAILTEQAEAAAAAARAGRKRAPRRQDPDAWKDGLPPAEIMAVIQRHKNNLREELFRKYDAVSHFSQLTIVNGTDGLHVWILDRCLAGSTANRVTSVASLGDSPSPAAAASCAAAASPPQPLPAPPPASLSAAEQAQQGTSGCYDSLNKTSEEDDGGRGGAAEHSAGASGEGLSGDAATPAPISPAAAAPTLALASESAATRALAGEGASAQSAGAVSATERAAIIAAVYEQFDRNDPAAPDLSGMQMSSGTTIEVVKDLYLLMLDENRRTIRRRKNGKEDNEESTDEERQ